MLPRLPLFPLAVVLFPGTTLPLHIFEPRYRRMLADCLESDRRFGITPPGRDTEAPDEGAVGCIAEVRVNQELPDGRSNIVVQGGPRFVVNGIVPDPAPYYVGAVEPFDDDQGTEPSAEQTVRLREQFLYYQALVRNLHDLEPGESELPDSPLELSFAAAAGAECDTAVKQRLLMERSTAQRVEALLALLPTLADIAGKALLIHRRAHGNGKGEGAHPGLEAGG